MDQDLAAELVMILVGTQTNQVDKIGHQLSTISIFLLIKLW